MLRYEISGLPRPAVNERLIKKCVQAFCRTAECESARSFSLAFVDAKTMRKFNRAYRAKDKVTDVLSFAQSDSDFIGPGEKGELGEILICLSRAASQAKAYGWTLDYEVCRLLVHGLAHLIGFEHEGVSKKEEEKMVKFEQKIIAKIKIN